MARASTLSRQPKRVGNGDTLALLTGGVVSDGMVLLQVIRE